MRTQRTRWPASDRSPHAPREGRPGFTIMELLVATALILFIMAIIAQAFGSAGKTFNTMRTAGQLQEKNRYATQILRKDMWADHFGPPYGYYGGTHVVHQRLDLAGWRPPHAGYCEFGQITPSRYEPGDPTILNGDGQVKPFTSQVGGAVPPANPPTLVDREQLFSTRAKDHFMRFTVRLQPGPAAEMFSASFHPFFTRDPVVNAYLITPGDLTTNTAGVMYTRWAEVHYFLLASGAPGDTTEMTVGTNPRPLHSLRRRVRLLPPREVDYQESLPGVPMTTALALQIQTQCVANFPDVVPPLVLPNPLNPVLATLRLPGPETLNKNPNLRIPMGVAHPTGDDILLTDVISFEVRAAWIHNPVFHALTVDPTTGDSASPPPEGVADFNTDEPFADLRRSRSNTVAKYLVSGFFDTWGDPGTVDWDNPISNPLSLTTGFLVPGNDRPPTRINVRAVQIKLRIWDKNAEQARQVTIVNEL